ncbi:MAG: MerR family transcriptional regulator [Anaerolineales bacterium]|nr:MerR family transcriptional regulator [Anaerolineales bacterium]
MRYTIKQIADLAGVTTRTLRYYDQIGLLSPPQTGGNGYRYYDRGSLLQLQQILFFRELDVPLKEIEMILSRPDFDLRQALEQHRQALEVQVAKLNTLIETVDQTIAAIEGEWTMNDKDYFEGFDEFKYDEEARQRWGDTDMYVQSMRRWKRLTEEQKEAIKQKGGEITLRMVGTDPSLKPDDPTVQTEVGEYFAYLNENFYTCEPEFLRNLGDMWVEDPRFAVNYECIREGGAEFVRQAVHVWVENQAKSI